MTIIDELIEMNNEITREICDSYCKYPQQYADQGKTSEELYDEKCNKCPLSRLCM